MANGSDTLDKVMFVKSKFDATIECKLAMSANEGEEHTAETATSSVGGVALLNSRPCLDSCGVPNIRQSKHDYQYSLLQLTDLVL